MTDPHESNPTRAEPDDGAEDREDARLARAAQGGDAAAVSALLQRYQSRLFGVCLRMLGSDRVAHQSAADLCQDSMVKLVQGLASFDGRAKFSTWAIRVAMNVVLSHLRSEKLRRHERLDSPYNPPKDRITSVSGGLSGTERGSAGGESARELSPGESVEQEERRATVAAALSVLDPADRALLVLRDVQGLEYEVIADVLGVPLGTVKSRLFRARLALRQEIERQDHPRR